jgi:hypothetical protein
MVQIVRHQLCRWLLISWVVQCTALRSMTLFVKWYLPPSHCASESTCWTNFYILFSSNNWNLTVFSTWLLFFLQNLTATVGSMAPEVQSSSLVSVWMVFFTTCKLHSCILVCDLICSFFWFIAFEFTLIF